MSNNMYQPNPPASVESTYKPKQAPDVVIPYSRIYFVRDGDIQKGLEQVRADKYDKVVVMGGEYVLKESLRVYSHTVLEFNKGVQIIEDFEDEPLPLISIENAYNVTILNASFSLGYHPRPWSADTAPSILINNSERVLIDGVVFPTAIRKPRLYIHGSRDITVQRCIFLGMLYDGAVSEAWGLIGINTDGGTHYTQDINVINNQFLRKASSYTFNAPLAVSTQPESAPIEWEWCSQVRNFRFECNTVETQYEAVRLFMPSNVSISDNLFDTIGELETRDSVINLNGDVTYRSAGADNKNQVIAINRNTFLRCDKAAIAQLKGNAADKLKGVTINDNILVAHPTPIVRATQYEAAEVGINGNATADAITIV